MSRRAARLVGAIRAAAGRDWSAVDDRELLRQYAAGHEAAFAAVVARHGGMVLGACRRALPTAQDAEDACQATFLVLARKAADGRWQPSVAGWLYATARRIASRACRAARRRAAREAARPAPADAQSVLDRMTGREAFAALDAELDRLPARYREPLVLIYLEGLTRDEAATRLGVPPATLKSRLERGRKRLCDALTNRGITLGAGLLAAVATAPARAAPRELFDSILAAAGGRPSEAAAALAHEVVMSGVLSKAKLAALAVGLATLVAAAGPTSPGPAPDGQPVTKGTPGRPSGGGAKEGERVAGEGRTVAGRVVGPDGRPVVAELAFHRTDAEPLPLGATRADGTFRVTLPAGPPGGRLVARADGLGLDFAPAGTPTEVTLRLPADQPIRGRVVDAQGKPVAGARVAATSLTAYENGSADRHLQQWLRDLAQRRGIPLPGGDRGMSFRSTDRGGHSPVAASTDADGQFTLAGVGTERLVRLTVRGPGLADTHAGVLTRPGFDPRPFNGAATASAVRRTPVGRFALPLYGPEPQLVAEPEKVIRGTVTDPAGRPRAGVAVTFSRTSERDLNPHPVTAVTGPDGRYEIRGARKHPGYMVECPPDPEAGLLPCQGFAGDTAGYDPVTIDLRCARGVTVTGTVTDAGTGRPIPSCWVRTTVLANNPHVKDFPPFLHPASPMYKQDITGPDGRFRVVTIPGPVLLTVETRLTHGWTAYRPVKPDPAYPEYFHTTSGSLDYYGLDGQMGLVNGSWCKVLDAKPADTVVTVDVVLEPATRTRVRVVDADGKAVSGTYATGVTHENWDRAHPHPDTDALTVFNLERERLVCVAHPGRRLVGTLPLKEGDRDPVVALGPGGRATGRATDPDGKPLAGLTVSLRYRRREVTEVSKPLDGEAGATDSLVARQVTTDANGRFRFDALFPGYEFTLSFDRAAKRYAAAYPKGSATHTAGEHGSDLDLGDLKLTPLPPAGGN